MCHHTVGSPASSEILFDHFLLRGSGDLGPQWNLTAEQMQLHNPGNSWESWENHLLTHQPRHWERKSRLITYIHEIFYSTVFSSVLKTLLGLSYLRKWFDCSLQESTSPNPSNSSLESKNLCPWILWIPCLKIFPFLFLPILDLLANLKFPHWKCRFKPNFQSSINSGLTSSPSPLPDAAKALRGGM